MVAVRGRVLRKRHWNGLLQSFLFAVPAGLFFFWKNEKFCFWSYERCVRDSCRFEVSLCFFGNTTRVSVVRFASNRIDNRAN